MLLRSAIVQKDYRGQAEEAVEAEKAEEAEEAEEAEVVEAEEVVVMVRRITSKGHRCATHWIDGPLKH